MHRKVVELETSKHLTLCVRRGGGVFVRRGDNKTILYNHNSGRGVGARGERAARALAGGGGEDTLLRRDE